MNKKILKLNIVSKGYAMLFTIVIISAISLLAAGMSNSILKQFILSSTARESQIAFYAAETGIECMLYAAEVQDFSTIYPGNWTCGIDQNGNGFNLNVGNPSADVYTLSVTLPFSGPCFSVSVDKSSAVPAPYTAKVLSRGYNTCVTSDPQQVERGIEVDYQ